LEAENGMNRDPLVRHILVIEDRESRRTISLDDVKYTIGRHPSNSIPISSKQISRHHATLICKTNRQTNQYSFWILDGDMEGNKSYNGIFINGEKSLIHELQEGDLINFGCEVNASYHCITSSTEAENGEPSEPTTAESSSSQSLSMNERSTFIIDRDLHSSTPENESIECPPNELDDDTFQEQSYLDPLTQLPNSILLKEYLSIALTNAKRKNLIVGLCLIEIKHDNKPQVNRDSKVIEHLIIKIAQRLKSIVRSGDIVARYQENQFAVLFSQVEHLNHLSHIIKRLNLDLKSPLEDNKKLINFTTCQSMAIYPQDGEGEEQLLKVALDKLEQCKTAKLTEAINDKNANFSDRLSRAESRLKSALSKEELEMYYQPQVNVKTGRISSMEALIRWNHPRQGVLPPAHFWPWAEKTDFVFPLTYWILQTTFRQHRLWQDAQFKPFTLSVNLSSRQFYHPQLANVLVHCLVEAGIEPSTVELEVTEATILEETTTARTTLHQLQKIGVFLSMDNFGIGHGAINYLREFPFHKLKIDRSLITQLNDDPKSQAMIQTLITIAQNFEIDIVAEGVETLAQIAILEQLNCNSMQGYQLSRPLTVGEAQDFLQKHYANSNLAINSY
jgi:diguanylate cyclase (GGDEF)-like protein